MSNLKYLLYSWYHHNNINKGVYMLGAIANAFDWIVDLCREITFFLQRSFRNCIRSKTVHSLLRKSLVLATIGFALVIVGLLGRYLWYLFQANSVAADKLKQSILDTLQYFISNLKQKASAFVKNFHAGFVTGLQLLFFNLLLLTVIDILLPTLLATILPGVGAVFTASASVVGSVFYAPVFEEIVFRFMLIETLKLIGRVCSNIASSVCSCITHFTGYEISWFKSKATTTPTTEATETAPQPHAAPPVTEIKAEPEISKFSILTSAVIFSAAHTGGPVQNIATFFGGLAMGYLYEKNEGDLTQPIAAHMANNAMISLFMH